MQLKVGILIIGSLFWDDGKEDTRKAWRDERLIAAEAVSVHAPIRYGRLSSSDTYTMVLSTGAKSGTAKVVPCIKPVTTGQDLLQEAQKLWAAECGKQASSTTSADWGCVALMFREESPMTEAIAEQWAQHVNSNAQHYQIKQAKDEAPLLSPAGLLQIAWPAKIDGDALSEVDALLAVANQPSLTKTGTYAPPEDIAKAWLSHKDKDHYFYKNRQHGIKTFEDEDILEAFWRSSTGAC